MQRKTKFIATAILTLLISTLTALLASSASWLFLPVYAAEEVVVFNLSPYNVAYEVWPGFKGDAFGNATFQNNVFKMWVNDVSGGWGLAKVCRGTMPHDWGLRYAPLDYEPVITKDNGSQLFLDIVLKLVDYANNTADNSSMNVAVTFFCDGYVADYYTEKCFQVELQFFSFFGDGVRTGVENYFKTPFNDSVAQFALTDNLAKGELKHYDFDVYPYFEKMMTHYDLEKVKIKHIEIFTEAYKGCSAFEVYAAKVTFQDIEPNPIPELPFDKPINILIITFSLFVGYFIITRVVKRTQSYNRKVKPTTPLG